MVLQQIWYQDAPLSCLSVYYISRELDNAFEFYNNFHTLTKRGSYFGNTQCDLAEI